MVVPFAAVAPADDSCVAEAVVGAVPVPGVKRSQRDARFRTFGLVALAGDARVGTDACLERL
jgi:hypothetical protein